MTLERKIYPSLDVMKFIMAMLILMQHTCNEWAHSTGLVHAFFGLGNFAVPFFFTCSGFLFFKKYNLLEKKEQNAYYRKWSLRIGRMYLIWSLIYFIFVFCGWIHNGLSWNQSLNYLHTAIVYSTYATIWFLPALWVGGSVCVLLKRYFSSRIMLVVILLLMIIGNLFGSYSNVLAYFPYVETFNGIYKTVFITWRNGLFNGAPYVFIGLLIADGRGERFSVATSALGSLVFGCAFLAEAYIIVKYHLGSATDMGFMMIPAIFFLMNCLVQLDFLAHPIWLYLRNISMLVFLGQRLFLSALPGVIPGMKEWILNLPKPFIYLYFTIVVLSFSVLIERLSIKYKFLKVLW